MKSRISLLALLSAILVATLVWAAKKEIQPDCSYKGKKLYGKIQFVASFPDIKVKAVEAFPDLKVKIVDAFPKHCGEWKSVDSFPDLKVQLVEYFPDIKIKFVDAFPGLP